MWDRIDYQYNVSGQLSNISISSTGASLSYSYDKAGQMTGVTGGGYGGVSTFLSQAEYRASGGVKTLEYGNGRAMNYGYNSRLQVSHIDMPGVISSDYTYYDDGRLKEISSVSPSGGATQISMDRKYEYDEMGRFSFLRRSPYGIEGGGLGYRINHSYNVFDNMEHQDHKYGVLIPDTLHEYSTTWLNNRNLDPEIGQDGYDKAGNLKRSDNRVYTYNSVGKPVSVSDLNLSYAYDGDSLKLKEVRTSPPQQGVPPNLLNYTTYFVRSAVLEGKIVMELDGAGQRKWDYIYGVGGGLLAEHNPTGQEMPGHKLGPRDIPAQPQGDFVPFIPAQPNKVLWYHMAPHDAMAWATRTDGSLIRHNVLNSYTTYEIQEKDLAGNIVDFKQAEFTFALGTSVQLLSGLSFISPYLGDAFNPGAGCNVDGVQTACGIAMLIANSDAARSIQVSDTLIGGPPHLNPFGSDVIFPSYIAGEIEYEKTDPETGDLIGYGYLPVFRTEIRVLSRLQNPENPAPLDAIRNANVQLLRDLNFGNISDKCRENVIDKLSEAFPDFDKGEFVRYLIASGNEGLQDGTTSQARYAGTITTEQAANAAGYGTSTIADVFRSNRGLNAVTSITAPYFTAFFRPNTIDTSNRGNNSQNKALLFHEALHGYGGTRGGTSYFDSDLQSAFGITVQPVSSNITQYIKDNCF
jgi:hypothetical protein